MVGVTANWDGEEHRINLSLRLLVGPEVTENENNRFEQFRNWFSNEPCQLLSINNRFGRILKSNNQKRQKTEGAIICSSCLDSLQKCQASYLLRSEFVILLVNYFNMICKCNNFVLGAIFSLTSSTFWLLIFPMINNLVWLGFPSLSKSLKCVGSLKSNTEYKAWTMTFWLEGYDTLNVLIFRYRLCYNYLAGKQQPSQNWFVYIKNNGQLN